MSQKFKELKKQEKLRSIGFKLVLSSAIFDYSAFDLLVHQFNADCE